MLIGEVSSTGIEYAVFIEEIQGTDIVVKPNIEIIQTVVGCGVHRAGTCFGRDMIAQNERHLLVDKRMLQLLQFQVTSLSRPQHLKRACTVARHDVFHHVSSQHD